MTLEIGAFRDPTAFTEEEGRVVRENKFCDLGFAALRAINLIIQNNADAQPEEDGDLTQDTKDSQKTE